MCALATNIQCQQIRKSKSKNVWRVQYSYSENLFAERNENGNGTID